MKFFKQNPVFSVLLTLFILLFIGGVVMNFMLQSKVEAEKKSVSTSNSQLRSALALEPAPTEANIETAEKNVQDLSNALEKQVKSTLGKKPGLISSKAPTSGTQMLFQLRAYRDEFAQVAKRTIPIATSDAEVAKMQEEGETLPSTSIPANFAFGFSRYIDSGEPPKDADVPVIYQQKEILTYILRKLFNTRPIDLVSVVRGPVELPKPAPGATTRNSTNTGPVLKADEFRIGSETARVDGAVETLSFKVVFTGYTENLRSFLKQIEEFEIPLVVRSVETVPLEASANVASASAPAAPASPFALFGDLGGAGKNDSAPVADVGPDKEPIVEENVSEFTVVLEYITVTVSQDDETNDDGEGDLS
ncbi:Amuc_1100 family pilus-like protein [Cerasicoccus arenae]|uniref:Uncharacterized protein n=1 Tax=Cerasicoccus arenae TaxID=424488 RepID=A0A8J3DFS6_9BACT|nr:Amuc_1100 family pilus-like protein [Cerasicoccus arenae]MBK1859633.1 hypothetical protein [Cerasicoccus arenae]GHB96386.1 hypothetical protein GCM10007047_10260 [Cerasicoccus arenae]